MGTAEDWAAHAVWVALMLVCALCALACLTFACIAAVKLQQMRGLMDRADARMVEFKRYYESMQLNGNGNGNSEIARQAAAWGAEVLGEVANGVPPDVAIQRSAARLQLPPVVELEQERRPTASEAGSDLSRVSELRGFDEHGNGWVTTTEREPEPARGDTWIAPHATLSQFAGYRPFSGGVRRRAHTSPPRRMGLY
jgi:hypothetical protein